LNVAPCMVVYICATVRFGRVRVKAWQADITVAYQDGCRLPFSKYGNAGCRVIGIGCMSKMAAA